MTTTAAEAPLEVQPESGAPISDSEKRTLQLVYILQAIGFFTGITFIAAVIINLIKESDMDSAVAKAHSKWQIRTFVWSAIWSVLGSFLIFVVVGYFMLVANVIWTLYRVIKGFIKLNEGKSI
jgi:uncharacterized membrane protein